MPYIDNNWLKLRDVFFFDLKNSPSQFIKIDGFDYVVESIKKDNGLFFYFKMTEISSGKTVSVTNVAINKNCEPLWHDNYLVPLNTALLYGSYVIPEFRGRGFYVNILLYLLNFFKHKKNPEVEMIAAIVERRNVASAKSHSVSGFEIMRKNYLLKFLGRNILSIYTNPLRCYLAKKKSNSF